MIYTYVEKNMTHKWNRHNVFFYSTFIQNDKFIMVTKKMKICFQYYRIILDKSKNLATPIDQQVFIV